jgi:hypothetical protein
VEFPNLRKLGSIISIESLPSLDYALYLTNTVKFHISQTYHLFQEQYFMQRLYSLYNNGPQPLSHENQIWYVQYFLIMALGKALLGRKMPKVGSPESEYFMRALELLPDVNGLYQQPILSIEVCCGLSLYLQAVDHRNSAYVYVSGRMAIQIAILVTPIQLGLGLRIALTQGLHRDLMSQSEEDPDAPRYRNVWWTLYILDRKFSSMMGAPNSVHDNDISVPVPQPHQSLRQLNALDMHIKLSRLMAKVLESRYSCGFLVAHQLTSYIAIYGIDGKLDASFPKIVQQRLRELAKLGLELNSSADSRMEKQGPVSRLSATLNLCYHQV